jgi:hypothetical protein
MWADPYNNPSVHELGTKGTNASLLERRASAGGLGSGTRLGSCREEGNDEKGGGGLTRREEMRTTKKSKREETTTTQVTIASRTKRLVDDSEQSQRS